MVSAHAATFNSLFLDSAICTVVIELHIELFCMNILYVCLMQPPSCLEITAAGGKPQAENG